MSEQEKLEKVIEGLECCVGFGGCNKCPYGPDARACMEPMHKEAIVLLKEQEPVIPKRFGVSWFCGNCKTKLVFTRSNKAAYCWRCGKAVKWDA